MNVSQKKNIGKIFNYIELMRLHRPIGILLLLWPILMALWLANRGSPSFKILSIFVCGTIIMRSSGCVINDLCDVNFDGLVSRTKNRPLVRGSVSKKEACVLAIILLFFALLLVLQLNVDTWLLSIMSVGLTLLYPLMKRVTNYPQIVLGLAFASGIPMVYTALEQKFSLSMWLLFGATVIWALIYDTMYAMVDKEDDLKIGVKSTAIAFGKYDKINILILQGIYLILFLLLGLQIEAKVSYYCCLLIALCLALYQQYLIKYRNKEQCFKAFLNNNYIGFSMFIAVALNS